MEMEINHKSGNLWGNEEIMTVNHKHSNIS